MIKPRSGMFLNCLGCNKSCYIPHYRLHTFKYCCRVCKAKNGNVVKIEKKCEICQKIFTHISCRANKAKYCSRKCYHKAQSKKGKTEYTCMHCGVQFNAPLSQKRKYCSKKCVNKAERACWHPKYSTVRKKMIVEGMITQCSRCGYNEFPQILGVHHKDGNRNNNSIENLEVVCPNCHSIIHDKHICH